MKPSGVEGEYLLQLMQLTPTAANVEAYIEIVREASLGRRLQGLASSAAMQLHEKTPPQEVCTFLQEETEKLASAQTSGDLVSSYDACMDFYNYLSDIGSGKVKPFVRSGYEALDRVLGSGFVNGGLYIIAARPGCGKTTLALQIADKVAKSGMPVMFMTLEMSKEQITAKRIAVEAGIPYDNVFNGKLTPEELSKVTAACSKLSEYPIKINKKPNASVNDISFLAHQVKGLGLIVIDYLGLIQQDKGKSLYEKVTETSNSLKRLARSLNVPIVCLAQLNRECEGRLDKKPRVSDLRDSGAIEQDADGILLLYRDMEHPPEEEVMPADLGCIVGKNRHGKTGEVPFLFFLPTGRIYSVDYKKRK